MRKSRNGTANSGATESPRRCFHCSEIIADGVSISTELDGDKKYLCCYGCKAIVETIQGYGLQKFYEYRTDIARTPDENTENKYAELAIYDEPVVQQAFVEKDNTGYYSTSLLLENIVCPACCWLIETRLSRMDGVIDLIVNYTSNRARLRWDNNKIMLSSILREIIALGYKSCPYNTEQENRLMESVRKKQLRRIALAGLLGMQVMMIALALYVGDWSGTETIYFNFFRWISLGLTLPVVIYSAAPFFLRAWRDIKLKIPGMDVPVALGIFIAFSSSCWSTITGEGEVYFDSVVMFVFLLSLGRYLEFMARKKVIEHTESLGHLLPAVATRLTFSPGSIYVEEKIPIVNLANGDTILVRPGETIPADGAIIDGITSVDEALMTGESFPVKKTKGDSVFGGSINIDAPVQIQIGNTGKDTLIARLQNMVERGREIKPKFIALADKIAAWFILFVLICASLVGIYWYQNNPSVWLPVTVSVLLITCPCALSLAMPTAMASAASALMKRGIAVVHFDAIETLTKSTWFIFDKTGTLTEGKLHLHKIIPVSRAMDEQTCLAIAKSLEQFSEHPLAIAVARASENSILLQTENIKNYPGEGIKGTINDIEYYAGNEKFIRKYCFIDKFDISEYDNNVLIYLADKNSLLAAFVFSDELREEAEKCVADIHKHGIHTAILSGDKKEIVEDLTEHLKIERGWSEQSPEQKVEKINSLQRAGEIVVMAGDGVNDAPVLATADVSIAMGSGTDFTRANADIILLNNRLHSLPDMLEHAMKTTKIIKQNLSWALSYNLIALPAAASGHVVPWAAALGMSMSSLLVILNSLRLTKVSQVTLD